MPKEKIVVIAGNYKQFRHWLQENIVPITNKHDLNRLRGIKISKVFLEGNYYEWLDSECRDTVNKLTN